MAAGGKDAFRDVFGAKTVSAGSGGYASGTFFDNFGRFGAILRGFGGSAAILGDF